MIVSKLEFLDLGLQPLEKGDKADLCFLASYCSQINYHLSLKNVGNQI